MNAIKEGLENTIGDIVSDEELMLAFLNTNFGGFSGREVLRNTLLKCACGYHTGRTARSITEGLGLTNKSWGLTKKGKAYLFAAYSEGDSV